MCRKFVLNPVTRMLWKCFPVVLLSPDLCTHRTRMTRVCSVNFAILWAIFLWIKFPLMQSGPQVSCTAARMSRWHPSHNDVVALCTKYGQLLRCRTQRTYVISYPDSFGRASRVNQLAWPRRIGFESTYVVGCLITISVY